MKMIKKTLWSFLLLVLSANIVYAVTTSEYCSGGMGSNLNPGDKQYKVQGSCDTQTRTCCGNFKWSDWGNSCEGPDNCSPAGYQCWTGSKCESPLNLGRCPKIEDKATWLDGKCVEGKGWQYTCKCNSDGSIVTYGNDDTPFCRVRACSSSTHYENFGSVMVGSVCNSNGSFRTGVFFGQSGNIYDACSKAAKQWWRGVSKYMQDSEIPDNSCRFNGEGDGGLGGYIISKYSNPSSLSGSEYYFNCSDTNTYYTTVYCVAFASKRCCNA